MKENIRSITVEPMRFLASEEVEYRQQKFAEYQDVFANQVVEGDRRRNAVRCVLDMALDGRRRGWTTVTEQPMTEEYKAFCDAMTEEEYVMFWDDMSGWREKESDELRT